MTQSYRKIKGRKLEDDMPVTKARIKLSKKAGGRKLPQISDTGHPLHTSPVAEYNHDVEDNLLPDKDEGIIEYKTQWVNPGKGFTISYKDGRKKSRRMRKSYTASEGWGKSLGLPTYNQDAFTKSFCHRFIDVLYRDKLPKQEKKAPSDLINKQEIIAPLRCLNSRKVNMIAYAAASVAIKRHNITLDKLWRYKDLIDSYISYGLFLGDLAGKFIPVEKISIDGLLDESGKLQFLKAFQREFEIFGLEGKLEGDSFIVRKVIQHEAARLIKGGVFKNLGGLYPLTESLREILQSPNLSPALVNETLPEKFKKKNADRVLTLETVYAIKNILNTATEERISEYSTDIGYYLLAKDLAGATGASIYLPALADLITTKDSITWLLPDKSEVTSRYEQKQRVLDFKLDELEQIIAFLRNKYSHDHDNFFGKYGSYNGNYNLAADLASAEIFNDKINRLSDITRDGCFLSKLLRINDAGFAEAWMPAQINMPYESASALVSHLAKRYQQNPKTFFEVYGSVQGSIFAAKELQSFGINIELSDLSGFMSDRQRISDILGMDINIVEKQWNTMQLQLSLQQCEHIVGVLRERYNLNKASFYSSYLQNMDALRNDLGHHEQLKVKQQDLEIITCDNIALKLLMGQKSMGSKYQK
jgi:hypothetical protein